MVTITAADYIGSTPVTGISCPDNGDKVIAEDLQNAVAALLANDSNSKQKAADAYDETPTFTTGLTTFQTIALTVFDASFPPSTDCEVGDLVMITFNCTVDIVAAYGELALYVKEPSGSVSGDLIPGTTKRIPIGTNQPVSLSATWQVTEAGALIVYAKGRTSAGGGTISVVQAYRLDAVRLR